MADCSRRKQEPIEADLEVDFARNTAVVRIVQSALGAIPRNGERGLDAEWWALTLVELGRPLVATSCKDCKNRDERGDQLSA